MSRRPEDDLEGPMLPMEMEDLSRQQRRSNLRRTFTTPRLIALAVFLLFSSLVIAAWHQDVGGFRQKQEDAQAALNASLAEDPDLAVPPKYRDVIEAQAKLPQHNLSLPFPEGATGRYVKFTSQDTMLLGWNNKLAEILLQSHLAYKSKRAYVFHDYLWAPSHWPWRDTFPQDTPARTPLTALLGGPTVGGPWPPGDPAPRAVHESYWDLICNKSNIKEYWTQNVKKQYGLHWGDYKNGMKILDTWQKILVDEPAQCVEIIAPTTDVEPWPEAFDLFLLGRSVILDLWDDFGRGLVSKLLTASPVVERTIEHNKHLFVTPESEGHDPFSRVLAVHVRRGDYVWHCKHLAGWKTGFFGWSLFPWLSDRFVPPPEDKPIEDEAANEEYYLKRCLPEMDKIIEKINVVRDDWEKEYFGTSLKDGEHYITTLYVLTNAVPEWHDEFAKKLRNEHKWTVLTTNDIVYNDAQEKDVGMATDMELARRAAIFLGNGWSSFTSSILHRRLVDKKITISNRFF